MNTVELRKILDEHKLWLESYGQHGSRADLRDANLYGADLRDSNLRDADLRAANLCGAELCGADLRSVNLCGSGMRGADLRGAKLYGANLHSAKLYGADLRGANLRDADLYGADLRGAELCGTYLYGADMRDAACPDQTFIIMGMEYPITITNGEYLRAGRHNHKIEDWRQFSKRDIAEMDGIRALKFYPRLLDVIDFYISKGQRPEWLSEFKAEECE